MEKIDFKKIVDIACRKKIYVIIILIISIILGCMYTFVFKTETYVSKTTFLLGVPTAVTEEKSEEESTTPVIRTSLRIDVQTVSTYNELVKSNSSIKEIKNNLNIDMKDEMLKKAITVSRTKKSDVIEISVKYKDKQIASDIANETVNVFSKKIKEIYKMSDIYVIDKAVPAKEASNINYFADIIIFVFLGILISFVYCIVVLLFDKTIKSQETIEEELGLKVLASIPNRKSKKQNLEKLIDFKKEKSPVLEGFENLKMNVQFTNINNKTNKVMLVTSSFSSEGKSYVAANVAAVFAKAGKKVIIIDMDMRAGRQASIFETPNNLGISNYLSNIDTNGMEINERINSYIKETSIKNLNLITSGSVPPNPSDLLASEKLPELIKDLSVFYDLIIFDGAPVLPVPDSLLLSRMAGSTILVSLSNKTKKEDLRKAKKDLQNIGGRIIGVVFHEATSKDKRVKKAYSKLETFKEEKEKNKTEIKAKISKIKKWVIEHIIIFKRKGEQLLLGQKEDKDTNDKENKEIKENTIKENEKAEIKEEIKTLENTDTINVIENENKSDNKKIVKEKMIKAKENTKAFLGKSKEKIKNGFDKNLNSLKENLGKAIKNVSDKSEKMKQKIKEKIKLKKELRKEAKENKKILKEEKINNKQELEEKEISVQKDINFVNEENYLQEKNEDTLEKEEKIKQEKIESEELKKQKEEQIKLEKAIKKEQEELEKMQKREERKEQKAFLKQEKRQKRINQKKERRKQRREKLRAKKEEIRIEEELLEDNLYPKTKHNKSL